MSEDDVVEIERRLRRPRGRDPEAVYRVCGVCGLTWPSITVYRAGESTRCPRCGASVDGDARAAGDQGQATLTQGGVTRVP